MVVAYSPNAGIRLLRAYNSFLIHRGTPARRQAWSSSPVPRLFRRIHACELPSVVWLNAWVNIQYQQVSRFQLEDIQP
jgi:hypothetical protein